MRSSFASFNTGLLGMRASQYSLDITGHNIVNIGTGGYTRQRVDQYSLSLNGSGSLESKIGQGVMISGISQIRDPYLDVRFRNEIAQVGYSDSTLNGLKDLESIINEVGVGTGIAKQFEELSTALSKLAISPKDPELENIVRAAVSSLTKSINQYAKKIDIAKGETEANFKDTTVPEINALMKSIQELNASIERNHINGNPALELMDQRNVLIDQLAQHVKIDVKYETKKIPGTERTYESLNIDYVDKSGDPRKNISLIDGTSVPAEFKAETVGGKMELTVRPSYSTKPTTPPTPVPGFSGNLYPDMDECGFRGTMELLNSEGSFSAVSPGEQRGYAYYTKMLDTMAITMAATFNEANKQMTDKDGNLVGGDMFGSSDGSPISAKNICVAQGWSDGKYGLIANRDPSSKDDLATNLLYMETLITSAKTDFYKTPPTPPGTVGSDGIAFTGTFRECFTNMHGMLGIDIKTTDAILKNHLTVAGDISDNIDSVSSVSLDEEGVNMMHYQKSLNAAIRFMTTIDEALNTVINNMGVVGR